MKNTAKLISSLLLLSWAFIASCSNCDDGTSSDSANQAKQTVAADSTFVN